ncbi:Chemotaxis protein CheY [uncultured bacterium]|nr:Chemotaxis protein CheY [uncultured bacterium]
MKKVILVADDSPTIRKFVTVALNILGYEVVSVADGMEAVEKLPSHKIDLVITDLNMPNMDGFELIKTIRESEQYKDLPVIILSSLAGSQEIERGMKSGANSYLVKPFDPKRLQYEVSKYIS